MWNDLRSSLRDLLGITPTLDLHGLGVKDALATTAEFVRHAQAQGDLIVRIVYGKGHGSPGGKGVLRDVIPHWLENDGSEFVERYQRLPDESGADGSVKVFLRPLLEE